MQILWHFIKGTPASSALSTVSPGSKQQQILGDYCNGCVNTSQFFWESDRRDRLRNTATSIYSHSVCPTTVTVTQSHTHTHTPTNCCVPSAAPGADAPQGPLAYTGPSGAQRCSGTNVVRHVLPLGTHPRIPRPRRHSHKAGASRRLRTASTDYNSQKPPGRGRPRALGFPMSPAFLALDYISHRPLGPNNRGSRKSH